MSPAAHVPELNEQDIYQEIFHISPEAIVVISKTGSLLMANGRLREWLGYSEKDLIGKNLLKLPFLSLKSKELILKNFLKRISGHDVKEYWAEFITKDGVTKHGKIRGALIYDNNKHVIADLVMVSEATEEYELQQAREKKENILEAINYSARYFLKSGISRQDFEKVLKKIGESSEADRVLLVINDLLMQRYEWVKQDVRPIVEEKEYPNFFHPPKDIQSLTEKLQQGKPIQGTIGDFSEEVQSFLKKFHIKSMMIQPIFVKKKWWAYLCVHDCHQEKKWFDGELDSLTIASELIGAAIEKNQVDIELRETIEYWKHEKEKVSQEIRNTQKFQQAVENSTDGVMITTPEPKIIYVNPAWERMNGYSLEEVEGKEPSIFNWKESKKGTLESMWETINKGLPFVTEEVINTRKDGTTFPVRMSVFPIRENDKNEFYVGVFEDITKRLEVDKMKTEFISIASHQLNTPLSAMKWFLELLTAGKAGELNAKQMEFVQNIAGSNQRMIALVRSLLNISRIESGRIIIDPRLTVVKKLIDEVITDLAPEFSKKQQKVIVDIDPNLPKIKLDPRLIRHVYMNLLSNSSKYSPEKTEILVSVTQDKEKGVLVSHVKDHGFGIPKQDQPKIFNKFFRAPNVIRLEADGSGLGLYLVKTVVDSSGGTIWLESTENKGTDFWFTLPLNGVEKKEGEVFLDQTLLS